MGTKDDTHMETTDRLRFTVGAALGIAALLVLSFFGG
jgi:hypothetical protein